MDKAPLKRILVILLAFLFFWMVYIVSMPPSYNSDDSPETTLAFHLLGIQHPPGYPLNTLIGKIFTFIPVGSYMFRANLMAVFFNLLAGFFIFLLVRDIAGSVLKKESRAPFVAGIMAASFYLFSSSAWLQGIIAKGSIYALNAFMLAIVLWSLFNVRKNIKYFYLFGFVYGLSLGNHWTSMAVIAPPILYYLYTLRKHLSARAFVIAAAFFLCGAGVYLYIFIRSFTEAAYAWGNTRTFKDFMWLISRAQYAGAEMKHSMGDTLNLLKYYFINLSLKEYPVLLGLLFIPGAVLLFRRAKEITLFLVLSYLFIVVSVAKFATPPANTEWLIKPYLVSTNIFVAVFMAVFLVLIADILKSKYREYLPGISGGILLVIFIAVNNPGYARYFIGYDYSNNISVTAGENSVVLAEGDMNIGAALYETLIHKKKYVPLIPVVMQYEWYREQIRKNYPGMANMPPVSASMKDYIRDTITANKERDVFYTNVFTLPWVEGIKFSHRGMLMKAAKDGYKKVITDAYLNLYTYRGIVGEKSGYDEFTKRLVFSNYSSAYFQFADELRMIGRFGQAVKYYEYGMLFAKNHGALTNLGLAYYNMKEMDKAEKVWREAIEMDPNVSVSYSNMAFIYIAKKDYKTALDYVNKAIELDPNNTTALSIRPRLESAVQK